MMHSWHSWKRVDLKKNTRQTQKFYILQKKRFQSPDDTELWALSNLKVFRLHFFVETFVVCCRNLCLQLKCVCDNVTTRQSINSPNSSKTLLDHLKMHNSYGSNIAREICRSLVRRSLLAIEKVFLSALNPSIWEFGKDLEPLYQMQEALCASLFL